MSTFTDALARRTALGLLARIQTGHVLVKDAAGEHRFGDPAEPEVTIRVNDPAAYRRWLSGSAGVGESYAQGLWDTDDLTALLRVIVRNLNPLEAAAARWYRLTNPVADPVRRLRRPDPDRDRTNVRMHYDLSNDFFAAFLDPTMTYSSAVFDHPGQDLQSAQEAKLDRLCAQVGPRPRGPRRGDRHRLGRLRHPRRPGLRLPGHHDHDLRRPARGGHPAGARRRPG